MWAVGESDRQGGEFQFGHALRDYDLPASVPGDYTFTVGASNTSTNWAYAQTNGGVWTIEWDSPGGYTGTAALSVSASLSQGGSPTVSLNGVRMSGAMPNGQDSTLSRQAIMSGHRMLSILTADASGIVQGRNTLTFSRASGGGGGMGYDVLVLNVLPRDAVVRRGTLAVDGRVVVNAGDVTVHDVRAQVTAGGAWVSVAPFLRPGESVRVHGVVAASADGGRTVAGLHRGVGGTGGHLRAGQ